MTTANPHALAAEDDAARAQALDIERSFLVQAPAGSGKTELLIQRYLALLARVDEPEHIVALTFTRKAAGEMRERVLKALADARAGVPVDKPHARITRELAEAVLQQDRRRQWSITDNASRMTVLTFDALATSIARRAPLTAGLGPRPSYVDDASALHVAAAESALAAAGADDPHWRTFLAHVDNNAARACTLIASLLGRRDQWLRQVTGTPIEALRAELEQALHDEIATVLRVTRDAFPVGIGRNIVACARHAVVVLGDEEATRELAQVLETLDHEGALPDASVRALPQWRALARFLMVKECTHFKLAVTKRDGFLPAAQASDAQERKARKAAMEALCQALNAVPGLATALAAASRLPEPRLGDTAWSTVEALLHVLQQAAAHLTLVFAAQREVDFVQGNLAALEALGHDDSPSDLLLRLDARVQHLLVDEFQDTSFTQLRLVERLTSGWQPNDGRTLFAVGDPMQSIYRFREAEVGHFIEAQASGSIASLPVERLRLRRNFRSQPALVEWVNGVFPGVLGALSDPRRGAVAFERAVAARAAQDDARPTFDVCGSAEEEAAAVVARILEARSRGAKEIAILVRARGHLSSLLPALRQAGIAFAAVELDKLSQRQSILDLHALTHALLQPADRTAWLAVLRAPWCGLDLHDLMRVVAAAGAERHAPLLPVLQDPARIEGLSGDGRMRLQRAFEALQPALSARGRATVASRVRGAWLALGGPACLDDLLDLDAAARFFELLDAHEVAGDVPDWDALQEALDTLHASSSASDCDVQVMTMHKAKGLEFDTVIVPGLARRPPHGDAPLLRWRRRDSGLLLAPGKPRGGEHDPLYRYLEALDREEGDAELGRLLYVACTRAKQRLHLVAAPGIGVDARTGEMQWKDPCKGSSLAKLWPALLPMVPPIEAAQVAVEPTMLRLPTLMRLPVSYRVPAPGTGVPPRDEPAQRDTTTPEFDWAREIARHIGTLAHRLLSRVAATDLDAWPLERIEALDARIEADLASAGFGADEMPKAKATVLDVMRRTLTDKRGRWLFDRTHEEARSEWAIAGVDNGELVRVVLDRSFVAKGERWIVDFKTGVHEGGDVEAFLDSEVERYRAQMERYARLVRGIDSRPIRLALYYPLVANGFREIAADGNRAVLA